MIPQNMLSAFTVDSNITTDNAIFLYIQFQAKTVAEMFSGEMPQEGATYGYRAQKVTDNDGVISVEMQFVRIDKEPK